MNTGCKNACQQHSEKSLPKHKTTPPANKKKPTLPKGLKDFKFKIYWIYAIIFIFFIGLQFIGAEVTQPTNWQEFNQSMLQSRKVEKVVIVNKEKAYIYIKKEFLPEEQFKKVRQKGYSNCS